VIDFFGQLATHAFLQNAVLAVLLASFACGIVGSFVVVKRIGYLAGGIAHAVLGGLGIAYFVGADPRIGAVIAALLAALIAGTVTLKWKQNEDTVISALWAVGMATGIVFISQTPGYNLDLMSYLFGNVLMVSRTDLYAMAGLDVVIAALVLMFYRQIVAVCFDEEFARVRGLNVSAFYLLLLAMVAVTVVSLIQVVGLILVIALLTLPAAIAGQFVGSIRSMIIGACLLGGVFGIAGLDISYAGNLPSGATIILVAGVAYLAALGAGSFVRARLLRRSGG
jgi:zinc transport system permease protein